MNLFFCVQPYQLGAYFSSLALAERHSQATTSSQDAVLN
jgi:hypothetical protein